MQSINIMCSNVENMIIVPDHKRNGEYYKNPSLAHFTDELLLLGKLWKENLFLQNQSINIVYPNKENMILVPNNQKNGDDYEYPSLSYFANEH